MGHLIGRGGFGSVGVLVNSCWSVLLHCAGVCRGAAGGQPAGGDQARGAGLGPCILHQTCHCMCGAGETLVQCGRRQRAEGDLPPQTGGECL